jgi:hypothetical protein
MRLIDKILQVFARKQSPATYAPVGWSVMGDFIDALEEFATRNEEVRDTAVRERLSEVAHERFILHRRSYDIPQDLGMFSDAANAELAAVLQAHFGYLDAVVDGFRLDSKAKRATTFFNPKLHSSSGTTFVDDFFAPL